MESYLVGVDVGWHVDGVVIGQVEDVEEVQALLLDVVARAEFGRPTGSW